MFRTLLLAGLVFGMVACNCPDYPECPDCPEPEPCDSCCTECEPCDSCCEFVDTLVCPDGYSLEKSELKWECVEIVEPPPPPPEEGPKPEDYVALARADGIINKVEVDSRSDIYIGIWTSVRNLQNAATNCSNEQIQGTFGITREDLFRLAQTGEDLMNQWERKFKVNLTTENWRYTEAGLEEFKGQSNLKKENWQAFTARVRAHNATINSLNELAWADPVFDVCPYDNLQGWCKCRNLHDEP